MMDSQRASYVLDITRVDPPRTQNYLPASSGLDTASKLTHSEREVRAHSSCIRISTGNIMMIVSLVVVMILAAFGLKILLGK
jgi:hypothetical protein